MSTTATSELSNKAATGFVWVAALRFGQIVTEVVKLLVLARLLEPDDFGLFGIALLALALLEAFSDSGFQQAVIQRADDALQYLSTVWSVNLIRGLLIAALMISLAPSLAGLLGDPRAAPLIQSVGLVALLRASINPAVYLFERELAFRNYFHFQVWGFGVDAVIAIVLAALTQSVWAFIAGYAAGNCLRWLLSYRLHPYRPRFGISSQQFKELWKFGRWILISNVLIFALIQGDDLLVGALLGATALGWYQLAYKISNLPASEFTHLISRVSFPVYSRLQDNQPALRQAYTRVLSLTTVVVVPLTIGIFLLVPAFTSVVLGSTWSPMVPACQILALYGLLRALGGTTGAVFMAVGKPKLRTKLQVMQFVILVAAIYPLIDSLGIEGAAGAVVLYAALTNPLAIRSAMSITGTKLIDLKPALKGTVVTSIWTGLVCLTYTWFVAQPGVVDLVLVLAIAAGGYLFLAYRIFLRAALREADSIKDVCLTYLGVSESRSCALDESSAVESS